MAFSTDVNLPKSYTARFPDKCVVCGLDRPDSSVRLITGSLGWWTWLLWCFGKPFTVMAPACGFCAWGLHLRRIIILLITIAAIVVVMWLVWPTISADVPRFARKWVAMGLILVCLLPWFIWQAFFPHAFDVTAYEDSVDYEFRDKELAVEFAALNVDADWIKVDDIAIK
jgi:hypothetical protein